MKVDGWSHALFEEVRLAGERKFEWGRHDCMLFVADCVKAQTGIDYAAQLRGYTTKAEAYALIERYGSIEAMVTALLGREPIHPAFAQTGDVLLIVGMTADDEIAEGLGVCLGVHGATVTTRGILMVRTLVARSAWRVE